jgi:hypothetical protein
VYLLLSGGSQRRSGFRMDTAIVGAAVTGWEGAVATLVAQLAASAVWGLAAIAADQSRSLFSSGCGDGVWMLHWWIARTLMSSLL